MGIFAWIILYGTIGFFEISSLVKNNMKKELIAYITIFCAAFILSIIIVLGIEIPSHDLFIGQIVRSITGE